MTTTLNDLIGFESMLGTVEDVKNGLPADVMAPGMLNVTKTLEGAQGSYFRVDGTRETAVRVAYGGASIRADQKGVSKVPVTLIHSFEHIDHTPTTLMQLQDFDSPRRQALGAQEVGRQTGHFFQRQRNLQISAVMSAMTLGAIYFDGSGNLLPSSAGAVVTIDFGVPAGNQDQLDILGDGDIITASWGTAGTDIISQVHAIVTAMVQNSGYRPTTAYYGPNVPGYFASNTSMINFVKGNAAIAGALAQGIIPDNTAGLNWRPLAEAFFVDEDGDIQVWTGDDTVVFAPEVDRSWWQYLEGTYPVPTDLGVVTQNAGQMMANVAEVPGFFSYATLVSDPVTVRQFAGTTMLPVIAAPKAIAIADVTP